MSAKAAAEESKSENSQLCPEIPGLALGKVTSGLFIVTAFEDDKVDGYLGSWIQQISFEPLMLQIAIKPGRPCYDYIIKNKQFCINIVGQQNNGVMKPFWKGYDANENPFEKLAHTRSSRGNWILTDCMAALECEMQSHYHPGDHVLLFATVLAEYVLKPEDKPLAHVRKNGLSY